ncbi:ATP-binding cassette domain-containing protein [Citreicella sp. C3M06]|uniref:ABC transporter ATP-binding protein n=1 Tax=Citreicella sp. C3M06 TaxID=2841564 RepID=UPI001C081559|nr:oligopeptide/dipeptide ABC transporter ATP-binding protein [Citreicella sp. C3M06]MBU2960223.1 ATP-binding cassette domain-containing protein [Citreicella sp. C3M06]
MSVLLEVENLVVRYPAMGRVRAALRRQEREFDAVAGVSFSIEAGQTLGLVGESGSGKSTVARTLMGLKRAGSGSIRFDGRDITRAGAQDYARLRREIAMMWQDPVGSLSPRLTVGSLVTEPLRIHGKTADMAAEAKRLLEMVGLPEHFAGRFPHQLSGGQARRVGVARALALDPRLIIADEPTAGLDMSVQAEVLNLLAEMQGRLGIAILVITHNLNVVRHITDRTAIMYLGRFVETGPTEQIFQAPRHPYTGALLSANPEPDPDAARARITLTGEMPSPRNRPSGCEFHGRCLRAQPQCSATVPEFSSAGDQHAFTCHFLVRNGAG